MIFLSNRDVKAMVGTGKNGRVTIAGTYRAQAPEGSIINGQVIDQEAFDAFLKEFWQDNRLPKKDVILVLGGAQSSNRVLEVPKMSQRKLLEHLPREFAAVEERKNPAFGYAMMNQEGTMVRLAAVMMDRSYLEPHMQRFKSMGIRLNSVVPSAAAAIMCMNCLSYIEGKTCVIQLLDGMLLTNILYVGGTYFQDNSSRIFGERGTPAFGIECARSISGVQQFLKTQQTAETVTHVYLGGAFREEDVEICRESILQMDDSLTVERLYAEKDGAIRFQEAQQDQLGDFIMLVGGLLVPCGKNNLFYQYRRDPETIRRHREMLRYVLPALLTVVVMSGIGAAQAALWFSRTEAVTSQFDYLENSAVIEKVAEYERLTMENEELDSRIEIVGKTMDNLNTYPIYTSHIKQTIVESAAGVASADITGVDTEKGEVSVNASSPNAEGAHQFVDRLEKRTDVFQSVYYDGFEYDDKSGAWKASVKCYLAAPAAGAEEVQQ